MIAVDGFDEFDVSSTEFSVWQSPVSDLVSQVEYGRCGFSSSKSVDRCRLERPCRLSTYRLRFAVVGVDDSNGGDEEVISTVGVVQRLTEVT
jgi:hypothetical protein